MNSSEASGPVNLDSPYEVASSDASIADLDDDGEELRHNGLVHEEPEMCRLAVKHLQEAIELIPEKDKLDYLEAKSQCPHLFETESDPIRFLRCENFNPWSAAQRLVEYWRFRVELFGERAFLPLDLTGESACDENDRFLYKLGMGFSLPPNQNGRPVGFLDNLLVTEAHHGPASPNWDKLRTRTLFSCLSRLSDNPASQIEGVDIIVIRGHHRMSRAFLTAAKWCFQRVIPIKLGKIHLVLLPSKSGKRSLVETLIPIVLKRAGSFFRKHVVVHVADSAADILRQLQEHGFEKNGLPPRLGGTWTFDNHDYWSTQAPSTSDTDHRPEGSFLDTLVAAATKLLAQQSEDPHSGLDSSSPAIDSETTFKGSNDPVKVPLTTNVPSCNSSSLSSNSTMELGKTRANKVNAKKTSGRGKVVRSRRGKDARKAHDSAQKSLNSPACHPNEPLRDTSASTIANISQRGRSQNVVNTSFQKQNFTLEQAQASERDILLQTQPTLTTTLPRSLPVQSLGASHATLGLSPSNYQAPPQTGLASRILSERSLGAGLMKKESTMASNPLVQARLRDELTRSLQNTVLRQAVAQAQLQGASHGLLGQTSSHRAGISGVVGSLSSVLVNPSSSIASNHQIGVGSSLLPQQVPNPVVPSPVLATSPSPLPPVVAPDAKLQGGGFNGISSSVRIALADYWRKSQGGSSVSQLRKGSLG